MANGAPVIPRAAAIDVINRDGPTPCAEVRLRMSGATAEAELAAHHLRVQVVPAVVAHAQAAVAVAGEVAVGGRGARHE